MSFTYLLYHGVRRWQYILIHFTELAAIINVDTRKARPI